MAMFMKVIGLMTRQKVLVFIHTWMVLSMKGIGRKINSMATGRNLGLITPCMKEITSMVRSTALANFFGLMAHSTLASFKTITLKDWVSISGQMGVLSMGIGETIKCMVKVCSHGQITGGMRVST
jgi:hypothetical protein